MGFIKTCKVKFPMHIVQYAICDAFEAHTLANHTFTLFGENMDFFLLTYITNSMIIEFCIVEVHFLLKVIN